LLPAGIAAVWRCSLTQTLYHCHPDLHFPAGCSFSLFIPLEGGASRQIDSNGRPPFLPFAMSFFF
jgi:hypothetical protein